RFAAEGWHVQSVNDSEELQALERALHGARAERQMPSFIAVRSHIAYPAPHAIDTAAAHGAPLGEDEVRATKEAMGFDPDRHFWVHERVYEHMSLGENGAAAHGGIVKPYGSTFLIFSDYMRPSVRLSALMCLPVLWVWTHDSVGLGEDGPTHQPIEHYAALRAIPHLWVIRPADANETAVAWRVALERADGPVALLLSRQAVPVLDRSSLAPADALERGAYVLWDSHPEAAPEATLI